MALYVDVIIRLFKKSELERTHALPLFSLAANVSLSFNCLSSESVLFLTFCTAFASLTNPFFFNDSISFDRCFEADSKRF